jgi:hypothetical protein
MPDNAEAQKKTRRYATTEAGEKYHIVPPGTSLLALGQREKDSNHASLCGVVPDEWEFTIDAPNREEMCRKCLRENPGEL